MRCGVFVAGTDLETPACGAVCFLSITLLNTGRASEDWSSSSETASVISDVHPAIPLLIFHFRRLVVCLGESFSVDFVLGSIFEGGRISSSVSFVILANAAFGEISNGIK